MPAEHEAPGSHRRRVEREVTLGERIQRTFEMPHLPRSDRNQRVAILAMMLMLLLYLLVSPVLSGIFGGGGSSPAASAPAGLREK